MTIRILLTSIFCMTVLLSSCATTENKTPSSNNGTESKNDAERKSQHVLRGRNYSFAIYNNAHRLITNPVEDLLTEMKWRKITDQPDISDIYLVSHGWNYTLSTAIANYHNYIEMIEKHMRESATKEFQPYFIFVTWTSTTRPTTDLAKAVLPFGVDSAVEPITSLIDKIPLHLFTNWKESLGAAHNALGTHFPNNYLDREFSDGTHIIKKEHEYGYRDDNMLLDADNLMGFPLPLSALIYELIQLKAHPIIKDNEDNEDCKNKIKIDRFNPENDKCVSLEETKLHMIGHSYGAKFVTMASMEAIRRWMLDGIEKKCALNNDGERKCGQYDELKLNEDSKKPIYLKDLATEELATSPYTGHISILKGGDITGLFWGKEPLLLKKFHEETTETPIESLVLFNPAFHPGELSYPVDLYESAPRETLKFIPRKAIVFTSHDYATGALFGLSGAILNTQINQWYQQYTSDFYEDYLLDAPLILLPFSMTYQAISGSIYLGASLLYTQIGQAAYSIINLPMDFVHHIKTDAKDGLFAQKKDLELNLESTGKGVGNAVDFFLPFFSSSFRDESEQGLYRISRPGLGKTGLNNLAKGRWERLNLAGLSNYLTKEPFGKSRCKPDKKHDGCIEVQTKDDPENPFAPNIDGDAFLNFTRPQTMCESDFTPDQLLWQREKFYSFDASQVYNTWFMPFVGAHSDLRKAECANKKLGCELEKRDHTFNFILRFTQTNFNEALGK